MASVVTISLEDDSGWPELETLLRSVKVTHCAYYRYGIHPDIYPVLIGGKTINGADVAVKVDSRNAALLDAATKRDKP